MDNPQGDPQPIKTEGDAGLPKTPEVVTLSPAEYEDLKKRADVSSQNFARLKKVEEDRDDLKLQLETLIGSSDPDPEVVKQLRSQINDVTEKLAKSEVLETYPQLKDMWPELEQFRQLDENKGMGLKTAAKAFLVERGLLEPQRKGLEKPTGGPRAPVTSGMSAEEVAKLRSSDYRKYSEMLRKGQIEIS